MSKTVSVSPDQLAADREFLKQHEAGALQARARKQRASCEQAARQMPTNSMARHQWAAKLAKRPTIGCRPQPEGAGGIQKPTDSGRAHKGSLLRYRDAERRDGAQTPSRLRFGRGRGHSVWEGRRRFAYGRGCAGAQRENARVRECADVCARAREREREHTDVFRMRTEAQRENARVSECAGGFVQMARNRTFRG